ncbi:MAG: glycosyl transferase, partial [Sulfurospirillaceae bacterium]|nr:glycosyl transferase [Sulfurospirillaceae bacterium]
MMVYFGLFLSSFILTYIIKKISLKKSLLAIPNERSSHDTPTPHGGGVAIAMTWFLGLVYTFTCKAIDVQLFEALMVGLMLSIVSFLDDLYELSPRKRLLTQACVSIVGLYLLGGLSQIDMGFFVIENQIV